MPVDPELLPVLATFGNAPPFTTMPLAEARALIVQPNGLDAPGPHLANVTDRVVTLNGIDLPARVYTPEGQAPLPLVIYFHGGGWVLGNLDFDDCICRELAGGAGCVVLSLDYRLAPEHKFPAATDDCLAVTHWAAARGAAELGIDPTRIVLAGMSAGGNLAAVTALRLRDEGGPALRGQILIVPVTDHYDPEPESYRLFETGYMLPRIEMVWFWDSYLADRSQANHPYAAPLRAADLGRLPPAFVATAEFDVLSDEGRAYAKRLAEAGVDVTTRHVEGLNHLVNKLTAISAKSRRLVADEVAWLRRVLA